jgi:hypothetical protein
MSYRPPSRRVGQPVERRNVTVAVPLAPIGSQQSKDLVKAYSK